MPLDQVYLRCALAFFFGLLAGPALLRAIS